VFHAGAYLEAAGLPGEAPRFLDLIPIRFGIADPAEHYHVPLLLAPQLLDLPGKLSSEVRKRGFAHAKFRQVHDAKGIKEN
jgi:hypothetical protein